MFQLLIIAVITFVLVKLTTFGFRPSKAYHATLSENEKKTARNLEDIVNVLSVDIGNRNYHEYTKLNAAADYIVEKFQSIGYSVDEMTYTIEGRSFRNIIAQIPKTNSSDETVIVGAHYDTCFNPGADDNASGIAGLIELARLVKDDNFQSNIQFIAFTNEEPPFFKTQTMGSRVYAKHVKSEKQNVKGVMILEMIGYFDNKLGSQKYLPLLGLFFPNRANFLAGVSNYPSRKVLHRFEKGFRKNAKVPLETLIAPTFLPGIEWSDHWSFWREGIPAIMVTDTAFLRNPHYHLSTDSSDTLNYEMMSEVVYGLIDSLKELDQL